MNVPEILDVVQVLFFGTAVSWLCQRYRKLAAVAHVMLGVILEGPGVAARELMDGMRESLGPKEERI